MTRSVPLIAVVLMACIVPSAQAKRAPNFEFKDLAGNPHRIADLHGSIVVLNFWATWCEPCREELPLLTHLSEEYGPRHVRFIAASANETKDRAKVDQFVSSNKVAMDIWLGADLDMLQRAGLGNELPATLILDENGNVAARILGEAREADLRGALDWILGGKTGPAPSSLIKHY